MRSKKMLRLRVLNFCRTIRQIAERSSTNHFFNLARPDLALLSMLFLYSCFL